MAATILSRFDLTGRVGIVTGAGRGIGAGIAVALAEAGADLTITARTTEQLERTAARIREHGRRAIVLTADVLDADARQSIVETTLAELGRLDILVNNVGGWPPRAALDTSDKDIERAFRMNVTHTFSLSRMAAPKMAESAGAGSIINISSVAGIEPSAGFSAYGTAKAALNFLTQEMAQDFAPKIRVNAIACGSIETEALATVLDDTIRAKMIARTPLARIGDVEDVAACALYLASDASSYVTGQTIGVHGGLVGLNLAMPRADL
jgi:7-alpha-hydroxysteroid dehydrogenase